MISISKKFIIPSIVVLSVLVAFLAVWGLKGKTEAPTAKVYLEPATLALDSVGQTGTIVVQFAGVPAAAGFQFELSFDKNVIRVDDVTLPTSPSDDITLIPLKDIRNEEGKVIFGVATLCEGRCPNILTTSPAVLTVSAVGDGATTFEFNASDYILYGTEVGADNMPVELKAQLTGGRVSVGAASR